MAELTNYNALRQEQAALAQQIKEWHDGFKKMAIARKKAKADEVATGSTSFSRSGNASRRVAEEIQSRSSFQAKR